MYELYTKTELEKVKDISDEELADDIRVATIQIDAYGHLRDGYKGLLACAEFGAPAGTLHSFKSDAYADKVIETRATLTKMQKIKLSRNCTWWANAFPYDVDNVRKEYSYHILHTGEPEASTEYTVEELKDQGVVGLYKKETAED